MQFHFLLGKLTAACLSASCNVMQWMFMWLLLLPFTAGANHSEHGKYIVGFAQDTLANEWRAAQVRQLEAEFKKYPDIDFIYTDANGQTARQIQDIEDLVFKKVDVLITSPRDAVAMTPVIAGAYKKGVKVILLTRKISGDDYTTLVAPDDEDIARKSAAFMAKRMNYKGRILMLKGVPTATTTIARTEGFMREISKHKSIQVVAVRDANYLRADAIRAVSDVLEQGIQFDAIYAQSDTMASGARLVMEKYGVDISKMTIVGIDYIEEARKAIKNGKQTASFIYPTSAVEAARIAVDIIQGKEVPHYVKVETQMVTNKNVDHISPIF